MGESAKWILAVSPSLIPLTLLFLAWGLSRMAGKIGGTVTVKWNPCTFLVEFTSHANAGTSNPDVAQAPHQPPVELAPPVSEPGAPAPEQSLGGGA